MNNTVTDLVTYSFVVAGILVMTRPKSQGVKFVGALTSGFSHIVQAASGQKITG